MSTIISNLVSRLTLDSRPFARGLNQASDSANRNLNDISNDFQNLGGVITGIFGAIAGSAVFGVVQEQIDEITFLSRWAEQLGDTVSDISELAAVAARFGAETEEVTELLKTQTEVIGEAALGLTDIGEEIDNLGLNAQELMQMRPTEAFWELADAMSELESQSERTVAALPIWETDGGPMLRFLGQGTEAFAEMRDEVNKTGQVVGQDLVEATARARENMRTFGEASTVLKRVLAESLLPVLTKFYEVMSVGLTGLSQDVRSFVKLMGSFGYEVPQQISSLEQGIKALNATRYDLDKANQQLAKSEDRLAQAEKNLTENTIENAGWVEKLTRRRDAAAVQVDKYRGEVEKLETQQEDLTRQQNEINQKMLEGERVQQTAAVGYNNLQSAAEDLREEFVPLYQETEDYNAAVERLDRINAATEGGLEDYDEILKGIRESYLGAETSAASYSETTKEVAYDTSQLVDLYKEEETRLQGLIATYEPLRAATDTYRQQVQDLDEYAERFNLSAKEKADILERLQQEYLGASDEASGLAQTIAGELTSAFDALFVNLVERGDNAFDNVLTGFQSLLTSLTQAALKAAIVIPINTAIGNFAAGGGGGLLSLTGGSSIGTSIGKLLSSFGLPAGGIGGVPNLALGLAGIGGGLIGSAFGGRGGTGGALGGAAGVLGAGLLGFGGPIGLGVGSLLGSIGGGLLGGLIGNQSDPRLKFGQGFPFWEYEQVGGTRFSTETPFGSFGFLEETRKMDEWLQNEGRQWLDAISAFDEAFASALDDLEIEKVRKAIQNMAGRNAEDLEEFIQNRYKIMFDALDTGAARIVWGWEDTTDKIIEGVLSLLNIREYLDFNAFDAAKDAIARAGEGLRGQVMESSKAVQELARDYDGSVDATKELGLAVQQLSETELAYALQLLQIEETISAMTERALERIQLDTMTEQQKQEYWRQQYEHWQALAEEAATPEELEEYASAANQAALQYWSLLGDEGKKAQKDLVEDWVEGIQEISDTRIAFFEKEAQALADLTKIDLAEATGMNYDAAKAQQAAANVISDSADQFQVAANVISDSANVQSGNASIIADAANALLQAADALGQALNTPISIDVNTGAEVNA